MSVNLNTTGGRLLDLGLPGEMASTTECAIDTFINESTSLGLDSAGMIDFGIAVCRATADNGCKLVSGDSDVIVGITTRKAFVPAPATGIIGYASGKAVGILRIGDIFATAVEAVRAGDQVLALTASAGGLAGTKGGVAGTGRLVVPGARWKTTTAANAVGIIEVLGRESAVLTS